MSRAALLLTSFLTLASGLLSAQELAPAEKFDVLEYRVLGVTKLSQRDVEAAVYPHLGPQREMSAVESARAALENAYRLAGLGTVFVDIPEQDIGAGIVRLRVTEGRVDRVRISGARYFSQRRIRERVPSLQPGSVPELAQVQREINALNNQSRDRIITPVLKAGRTPGTVDVDLNVKDDLPLHGSLEVNDRYTANTTRTRALVSLSYDNLFDRRHSLSLQYQTAPQAASEAQVLAATYAAPLGESGNMLVLYGVDTDSDVAALGTLSVIGKGQIFGARLIVPLPVSASMSHSFSAGFDYKDFSENVRLTADSALQTPISYLHGALQYNAGLRTSASVLNFNLGVGLGLRGAGGGAVEFEDKRFLSRPNYVTLRGGFDYERVTLAGLRLFGRFAGQLANDPLISNEQFAIGGFESVRGYLESEQLGDVGFGGSIELRSMPLTRWLGEPGAQSYMFGFFDAGLVRLFEPLPSQTRRTDLSSWGIGVRAAALHGFEADLSWAYPLVPAPHTAAGESRMHFLMRYRF